MTSAPSSVSREWLAAQAPHALADVDLPFLGPRTQGKVRDLYSVGEGAEARLVMVASDRLSAFDRILGLVPCKGQVLTQLAAFWFHKTRMLVPNALIELPDPNVTVARRCRPLPVEVVVRGYITGVTSTALWRRYELGERQIYGYNFPEGLHKNDPLPAPIITPTTKGAAGAHDERITVADVAPMGLATADEWEAVQAAALALFACGQEIAARAGLLLVDTKYEFGVDSDGRVTLIDEVHTPDSSRFWRAESYPRRQAAGQEPENFDKEFVRLHHAALGYRGEGEPPPWTTDLAVEAAERYIAVFEQLTGQTFAPGAQPAAPRIEAALRTWLAHQPQASRT
jgi:phosphoribosylaminoimidazole-succinocarboxamide synthase